MRKLLIAALLAGSAFVAAPPANAACVHSHDDSVHAHTGACDTPAGYSGGCGFGALNDTTPGGQLGGQEQWNGEVHALVVAADDSPSASPDASVTVRCELLINGVSQGDVLTASGTFVAAGAGEVSFPAAADDIVTLCDIVTINNDTTRTCENSTTTQIVPEPVIQLIELVIDTINGLAGPVDAAICPLLASLSPGIPGVVDITLEGDVYLYGEFFWDCPPYAV